jgi:DNA polymerase-3 subunit chi
VSGPRVAFYIVADGDERARRTYACRLVEKAYLQDHRVVVRLGSGQDVDDFDELLWRFSDRSFVPHEVAGGDAPSTAPVLLTSDEDPPGPADVLVNLADDVPPWFARYARVAELVGGADASREAGRGRFRYYREQGLEPETHTLGAG